MSGKTLDIHDVITEDQLGCRIANQYVDWNNRRKQRIEEWKEIHRYLFATDTSSLAVSSLPWKNTTHIPKICQIRDNLHANYMASMFPKRKWLIWEGATAEDEQKKEAIESYMRWVVAQPWFKNTISKLIYDYLDYGICIGMPSWKDQTSYNEQTDEAQTGYVGPEATRISPLDIVFNPTAPDFESSPKIVRSLTTMGELKKMINKEFHDHQEKEQAENIFNYLRDLRRDATVYAGEIDAKDSYYDIEGFSSFKEYLGSNFVEVLTFYGDIWNEHDNEFLENYIITVIDRHKILFKRKNETMFGYPPFASATWRDRQDNLWGMGPFDNLIGLQYRMDSVENQKADMVDLTTVPPLKVRGYVEDFNWGPMEKIAVGDDGDVDVLLPDFNPVSSNIDIQSYETRMEEMAGSPKEAMGFRTPGEKTAYEVQRLENAASRIFQNKIAHFEEQVTEKLLNYFLELAKRNMSKTVVRVVDSDLNLETFQELTKEDITGVGRIRPVAARHFAEKAEFVQNLNQFYQSGIGSDPEVRTHLSSTKLAEMINTVFDAEAYQVYEPYIRLQERAEAAKLEGVQRDEVAENAITPSGLNPEDTIEDVPEEE